MKRFLKIKYVCYFRLISDPSYFGLFGGRRLASALEGRRNNILILCLCFCCVYPGRKYSFVGNPAIWLSWLGGMGILCVVDNRPFVASGNFGVEISLWVGSSRVFVLQICVP